MAELIVDFIASLDGYAAADGWPGWWEKEGPEHLDWLGKQPEANYTVLMGANTYRLMSGLANEGEPGTGELAKLSKVVFSSKLSASLSWPNTRLVSEDPEQIYDGYPDVDLELVSARTFDEGLQLLDYIPPVLTGPPSENKGNR